MNQVVPINLDNFLSAFPFDCSYKLEALLNAVSITHNASDVQILTQLAVWPDTEHGIKIVQDYEHLSLMSHDTVYGIQSAPEDADRARKRIHLLSPNIDASEKHLDEIAQLWHSMCWGESPRFCDDTMSDSRKAIKDMVINGSIGDSISVIGNNTAIKLIYTDENALDGTRDCLLFTEYHNTMILAKYLNPEVSYEFAWLESEHLYSSNLRRLIKKYKEDLAMFK